MKQKVIAVLCMLVIFILNTGCRPANVRVRATDAMIKVLRAAVLEFAVDCGALPSTEQGLKVLFVGSGIPGWGGVYLRGREEEVLDGWGTSFRYESDGTTFEIRSAGADGIFATHDDQVGL